MGDHEGEWTLSMAAKPILWSFVWAFTCLVVVSFPESISRRTGVMMVFAAGYGAWQTATDLSPDMIFNEIYVRYILICASHILAMVYKNPGTKAIPNSLEPTCVQPTWNPLYRGWKTVFNARGIGTQWEAPYLWPGIKHTSMARKPTSAPDPRNSSPRLLSAPHNLTARSKWAGIGVRCGYLLLNFLALCLYYEFMEPQRLFTVPPRPSDWTRDKEGIVRRLIQTTMGNTPATPVTSREFHIRAVFAIDKVAHDFLLLSLYHDAFAIFWLSIGLDESWEWPPLYGRISDAYTVRRFWSLYWHRLFYKSASSHAALVLRFFRVGSRTPFSRILVSFLVFGLSAVMHAMVDTRLGRTCAWGRNLWYWLLQPAAFVMEGLVQFVWVKSRCRHLASRYLSVRILEILERLTGYAWVCAWLLWEGPKRSFPMATCQRRMH
ncbi:hypothetical protein DPSP01_010983 [Paraphaeosphaeria sporulosa]|uniref:Wax synthase domain-containing protein n=1 Tax=Paraphaeosphaeria sporulosa TaxID=1460663 RepID=A0A177D0D8_9PLEO|nr:uncharacterized protein CC84DRAFT_184620 [Paraphaeosphaeria sporulosa]OAG13165.1 hypothetical protein CC84DRAFT_184620 [Paraphaeosphaeria sporulosa]